MLGLIFLISYVIVAFAFKTSNRTYIIKGFLLLGLWTANAMNPDLNFITLCFDAFLTFVFCISWVTFSFEDLSKFVDKIFTK